jgi:phosphate uptake regulator
MSEFKRLWTKLARFAEALEGLDDPTGDYILSLRKRVDKLERDVEHLERQLHSSAGGRMRL